MWKTGRPTSTYSARRSPSASGSGARRLGDCDSVPRQHLADGGVAVEVVEKRPALFGMGVESTSRTCTRPGGGLAEGLM
jgi:hypothetical protein